MSSVTFRKTTPGGIRFKSFEGSPQVSVSEDGVSAIETILIDAINYESFIAETFPPPVVVSTNLIQLPARRALRNGLLVAKQVDCVPFTTGKPGDPFQLDTGAPPNTYSEYLKLTIRYESDRFQDGSGSGLQDPEDPVTFTDRTVNVGSEYLKLNAMKSRGVKQSVGNAAAENFATISDNLKVTLADQAVDVIKTIPRAQINIHWPFVIVPNWTVWLSSLGTINRSPIDLFFKLEPETVMFTGMQARQKFVWYGGSKRSQPWDVNFQFEVRRIVERAPDGSQIVYGFNHSWSGFHQQWLQLFRRAPNSGQFMPLHAASNFEDLFKSAA